MGPDGTIYFREYPYYGSRIWKRSPQGAVTPLIGSATMSAGCGAAGLPGSQTQVANSVAMAISPLDGLLYYAQADNGCPGIRRLRADGVVENVTAPSTAGVETGVGGPASAAQLPSTAHIVFGADGTLYIAAGFSSQPVTGLRMTGIYTIAPDGILRRLTKATQAGSESQPYCYMTEQNNIPLANATWPTAISYIDVDKDGRILFSQQCSIKKVENGIVTTVAGAGYGPAGPFCGARCAGSLSMGVNALSADASGPDKPYSDAGARAVAWDGRGGFYFATAGGGTGYGESQGDRIRHVTAEGIVESYMGDGTLNIADNSGRGGGMPASALKPGVDGAWIVGGMKLGPDGALYVGNILPNYQGGVITRVSPFLPGFTGADLAVPSESGNEVYVFNSVGRHLRTVSNTNVTLQTFGYDSAGRLTSITDRSGNVVTIERNASGQMTAIVAPGGQRNTLTVDGNGYLTAVANPAGQAYALGYAPGGLLASLTDPRAGVHSYEYDGLGYLVKDTDPAGAATTLARAADGTVTLTNALGLTQSFAVATAGSLTETRTSTAPSGAMTTTSTNTAGVTTSTDSVGDTMTTRLAPDARFGMSSPYASNVSVATPLGTVTTTFSRQLTVPDLNNPFSLTAQTDSFTVNGRTSTMTYTVGTRTGVSTTAGGSGSSRRATIVLDALLRPIQETREVGQSPVTYSYRADGLVQTMTQGATSTALAYDSARRLTTRTNAIGQRVKVTYDSADRVSAMTYAETTPVAQDLATFQYAYDANGNRTSVTMPSGAVHGFAYDARDLVTSYTPPDGSAMALAYDGIKRLSQLTLGDGRNVSFSYDAAGRMTGTTFPEGSTTRSYVGATERLASAVRTPTAGAAQSIAFTYAGSALTGLAFAGPATGAYAFTYDVPSAGATNLWVASRSLDGGPATPFAYDADGLTTVEGPFGLTRSGPRGATSAIRIGATTHWTYGYDALGRRTSRVLNAAGSRYSSTLSFDAGSQLTGRVESVNGAAASTYAYKYDGRGQLVEVKKDNVVVESYAYDVNGNRTSALVGGNPVTTTYDAQDRIVTRDTTAYTYDAAGFLTQRGSDTFVYSARGELLSATVGGNTVTYGYDAGGRRVARTDGSGTTEYLYSDGSFYVTHSRAPGGMVTEYFYDDAGRLYALRRGGTNYLVGTDEVGTPKIVVDAAGVVALTAEYDAWGVALGGDANTFDIPQGFAGGLRDATTGLVRFGYRDYEPASGRWTARDPMGFSGGTNLFAYIANAPTLVRDPSGLEPSSEHYWRSYEYRLINNFEAIPKDAAEYTVGIHGGENGQFWAFNQWVSPEVLAAMIKGRLGFRPGMPIRLVACWSGRSGAAQALANALLRETGVPSPVIAPDNLAVLPSDGKVYSGVEGGYGDYVPIVPSGDFRTYWPSVNPRLAR
ncbi:MAG: hypothetical protein IPG50_24030 [Myxococcales bacterium]|nr:hypothetical protein [Myxococcales bacterium]